MVANKNDNTTQLSLLGLLEEAKNCVDESQIGETVSSNKQKYYDAKLAVKTLEKTNDKYVYLIPSATQRTEFPLYLLLLFVPGLTFVLFRFKR